MEERISRLEADQASLKDLVSDIAHHVTLLRGLAEDQVLATKAIKSDISDIKVDISGLKSDISGIKGDVAGLKADVAGLKVDISGIKSDVGTIQQQLAAIAAMLKKESGE